MVTRPDCRRSNPADLYPEGDAYSAARLVLVKQLIYGCSTCSIPLVHRVTEARMDIAIGRLAVLGILLLAACGGGQSATTPPEGAPAPGAKSAIGGACTGDAQCQEGLTCDKGDPGGNCQKQCATAADCGAGAVCGAEEKKCYHA